MDMVIRHPYQFIPGAGLTGVAFANGGPGLAIISGALIFGACWAYNNWDVGNNGNNDAGDDLDGGITKPPIDPDGFPPSNFDRPPISDEEAELVASLTDQQPTKELQPVIE